MKNSIFTVAFSLLLASCVTSDVPNFERMSEDELAAYNNGKPLSQMMVCSDQARTFSRVRRRRCMTVEAMYGSTQQASQLGILHTIPGYVQSE